MQKNNKNYERINMHYDHSSLTSDLQNYSRQVSSNYAI